MVISVESKSVFDGYTSQEAVIYFGAPWCAPCKIVSPLFKRISSEYPDTPFLYVDVSKNQAIPSDMQVQSVPTIMLMRGGFLIFSLQGDVTEAKLRTNILGRLQGVQSS